MTYEDMSTLSAIVDTSHDLAYRFIICLFFWSQQCAYSQEETLSIVNASRDEFQRYVAISVCFQNW